MTSNEITPALTSAAVTAPCPRLRAPRSPRAFQGKRKGKKERRGAGRCPARSHTGQARKERHHPGRAGPRPAALTGVAAVRERREESRALPGPAPGAAPEPRTGNGLVPPPPPSAPPAPHCARAAAPPPAPPHGLTGHVVRLGEQGRGAGHDGSCSPIAGGLTSCLTGRPQQGRRCCTL